MNIKRMRELRDFIKKTPPKHFRMDQWWDHRAPGERTSRPLTTDHLKAHGCGTAACLAGYAVALFGPENTLLIANVHGTDVIEPAARKYLGLRKNEASRLFRGYWSKLPKTCRDNAGNPYLWRLTVLQAVRELNRLINAEQTRRDIRNENRRAGTGK